MGFLMPKVKAAPPVAPVTPEPEKKAVEIQQKQEARIANQEAQEQRKIAARTKARRTGGYRSLLSPDREDAMVGLNPYSEY